MVRQFRLYGLDTKTEIDLNDFIKSTKAEERSWYLLTLPTGLGFEFTQTYVTVGTSRIKVAQEQKYNTITGTIEVSGRTRTDWELNYNNLRDFIAKNKKNGFKLYYKNTENKERYINCDVKLFNKTEKSTYCIPVGVQFETKTLWLDDEELSYTIEVSEQHHNMVAFLRDENMINTYGESDKWSYNYGFLRDNRFTDIIGSWTDSDGNIHNIIDEWNYNIYYMPQNKGEVGLTNFSDAETPLKVTIYGACENPEIQILDSNGEIVQKCKIYASLENDDRLIINSDPNDLYILLKRADVENPEIKTFNTDLGEGYKSFLTLPVGQYTLRIIDGNNSFITGNIRYSLQYLGG